MALRRASRNLLRGGRFYAVQCVRERSEQFGILGGGADADADRFRKTHPGHRANNDAFLEEFIAESSGVGADGDKQKIGFARDGSEVQPREFEEQAPAFGAIRFDGTADVFGIVESRQSGGLADARNVEGRTKLVHFSDKRRMADAVADAQSGEAIDFGERFQGEDVVVPAEEFAGLRQVPALGILVVGLVEDDEDVAGNVGEEGGEFVVAEGRTGGIVGIRDVDNASFRYDRSRDSVEIEGEIAHGRLREIRTAGADGNGEKGEAAFARDAVKAGAEKHAGGQVDHFA